MSKPELKVNFNLVCHEKNNHWPAHWNANEKQNILGLLILKSDSCIIKSLFMTIVMTI